MNLKLCFPINREEFDIGSMYYLLKDHNRSQAQSPAYGCVDVNTDTMEFSARSTGGNELIIWLEAIDEDHEFICTMIYSGSRHGLLTRQNAPSDLFWTIVRDKDIREFTVLIHRTTDASMPWYTTRDRDYSITEEEVENV